MYRTWSAYLAYLLLGTGLVFGVDRLQRRRLLGKERERAQFAEARLRAEAAEALARTESEGKKQVELLSGIGREITASLDFDTISGGFTSGSTSSLTPTSSASVSTIPSAGDRVPAGDRRGQALRAVHAGHQRP